MPPARANRVVVCPGSSPNSPQAFLFFKAAEAPAPHSRLLFERPPLRHPGGGPRLHGGTGLQTRAPEGAPETSGGPRLGEVLRGPWRRAAPFSSPSSSPLHAVRRTITQTLRGGVE